MVETPQQTPPPPKPRAARRTSSVFSLKEELNQSNGTTEEETTGDVARKFDPATEQKLGEAKESILAYMSTTRPRFKPFFEVMKISSEAIELTVPTEELKTEIRRAEIDMMAKIVEIAKISGYVELRIAVNEEATKSHRPIKLEDRVAHFSTLNPLISELTKALDLQVDS